METSHESEQTQVSAQAPRRPLPRGRVYHFNVVYNHAKSKLSRTADTELSLSWTKRAVEWLQLMGLVNSYYHDRDCAAGQGLVQELTRVLEGSEVTVLVLSPGFVRDCWPRYSLLTCFKSLLNNSKTSSTSSGRSSRRVMPVALGLDAKDLPPGLNPGDVMFFKQDWQEDDEAWSRLRASMLTSLPAGGPVWEDDQDGENVTGDDVNQESENRLSPNPSLTKPAESKLKTDVANTDLIRDVNGNCDIKGIRTSPPAGTYANDEHRRVASPRDGNSVTTPPGTNNGDNNHLPLSEESPWSHLLQQQSSATRPESRPSTSLDADSKVSDVSLVNQNTMEDHSEDLHHASTKVESQVRTHITTTSRGHVNGTAEVHAVSPRLIPDMSSTQRTSSPSQSDPYHRLANDRSSDYCETESASCSYEAAGPGERKEKSVLKPPDEDVESAVLDRLGFAGIRRESVDSSSRGRNRRVAGGNRNSMSPVPPLGSEDGDVTDHGQQKKTVGQIQNQHHPQEQRTDSASGQIRVKESSVSERTCSTTQNIQMPAGSKPVSVSNITSTKGYFSPLECTQYTDAVDGDFSGKAGEEGSEAAKVSSHASTLHESCGDNTDRNFVGENKKAQTTPSAEIEQSTTEMTQTKEYSRSSQTLSGKQNGKGDGSSAVNSESHDSTEGAAFPNLVLFSPAELKHMNDKTFEPVRDLADKRGSLTEPKANANDTESEYNHITSIEDDHHDFSFSSDFLSTSLTSDYGTMSPRMDLSGLSNPDSGFLSGSLSSFGESPRHPHASTSPRAPSLAGGTNETDSGLSPRETYSPRHVERSAAVGIEDHPVIQKKEENTHPENELGNSAGKTSPNIGSTTNKEPTILADHTSIAADDPQLTSSSQAVTFSSGKDQRFSDLHSKPAGIDSSRHSQSSTSTAAGEGISQNAAVSGRRQADLVDPLKVDSQAQSEAARKASSGDVSAELGAKAAPASGQRREHQAAATVDTWEYADVDRPWSLSELLLPLYRIMVYAFSRPEMPYNF